MPSLPTLTHPTGLPICDCTEAWEPHEHGTRGMYGYHRCRCAPCRTANRDYNRENTKYRPRRQMVDADLVRARIAKLRAAGLTLGEIADMCAVNSKVIDFAVHGRNGRKPKTVQASTFRALNAISSKDIASVERPRGRKVDGDIPRRQIQSLHSFGWGMFEIGSRANATAATLNRILKGFMTTEELRASIDRVHAELHGMEAPTATTSEKARASKARTRADANGWTPDTSSDLEYSQYVRVH
ncbi:hypothetical protein [Arthrobacter terrae]|nr:hypothetical protein [Arthrobacter terrae]